MTKHISIHSVDEPGRTWGTVTAVMQVDPLSRVYAEEENSGYHPCPFLGSQEYVFRPICLPTYHLEKGRDIWCNKTCQIATLAKAVTIRDHILQPHDV